MTSRLACISSFFLVSAYALFAACQSSASKPVKEQEDPIARFAGRWWRHGRYNILGEGSDQIWRIERGAGGWTIAITAVRHPSVNEGSRVITRVEYAPTPLTWRDGCLQFTDPRKPQFTERITIDLLGDRMLAPAIVQRDERTWEYSGPGDRDFFRCEHDPHVVPTGKAELSLVGYPKLPAFYRMIEVVSDPSTGTLAPCVEFFQIDPNGADHPCVRLVIGGEPWGNSLRLGTTWSGYAGEAWERMPDDKWREVQSLPLVQPP